MTWELKPLQKYIDIAGLYSFHYSEFNSDYYFPGERHDFWEMIYVDSGEMQAIVDSREFTVKQGDAIFFSPLAFHIIKANRRNSLSVLVTAFEVNGEAMNILADQFFSLDKQQRRILSQFLAEGRKGFPGHAKSAPSVTEADAYQLTINYLEQLLIDLIRKATIKAQADSAELVNVTGKEKLAEAIDAYLEAHLYDQLQLTDLCHHFNKSSSGLCRLYKSATGNSIMEHYLALKISRAKSMLLEGEMNITQISEQLGFGSIHYFTRIFKNKTGMPPGTYKKTIKDWQTAHNRNQKTPS